MENVWVLALLTELTFIFTATYFSYQCMKSCSYVVFNVYICFSSTFNNLSAFLFTNTIVVTYRMDGTGKTFGLLFSRVILDVSCILVLSGFFYWKSQWIEQAVKQDVSVNQYSHSYLQRQIVRVLAPITAFVEQRCFLNNIKM